MRHSHHTPEHEGIHCILARDAAGRVIIWRSTLEPRHITHHLRGGTHASYVAGLGATNGSHPAMHAQRIIKPTMP